MSSVQARWAQSGVLRSGVRWSESTCKVLKKLHFWGLGRQLPTEERLPSGLCKELCYWIKSYDPAQALAQLRFSASAGKALFSTGVQKSVMKLKLRWTEQQDLFTGQSRESWELSSQINFSATQWDKSLKSKDKRKEWGPWRRGIWERGRAFSKGVGCHPLFILIWSLKSTHGCQGLPS